MAGVDALCARGTCVAGGRANASRVAVPGLAPCLQCFARRGAAGPREQARPAARRRSGRHLLAAVAANAAGYFVNAVGEGAGLGSRWKRGNAYFDEALRQVDAALSSEEARGGPLLKLDRGDMLDAVNVPWTSDDLAFLIDTTDTELGRQAQRAIDAKAALQMTHTLARRIGSQPGAKSITDSFRDLEVRAQSQYGDAAMMLLALKGADPQRAKRLQTLVEAVETAPVDALGKRLTDKLSQRLLDAAAAQLPNLIAIVAGFRSYSQ